MEHDLKPAPGLFLAIGSLASLRARYHQLCMAHQSTRPTTFSGKLEDAPSRFSGLTHPEHKRHAAEWRRNCSFVALLAMEVVVIAVVIVVRLH
jgi:hypothetical protein